MSDWLLDPPYYLFHLYNYLHGVDYLEKSNCKCEINVRDQTYTKIWFVTSTELSVISSELLSLPQTISLYNKIELSETCHFHQFFSIYHIQNFHEIIIKSKNYP